MKLIHGKCLIHGNTLYLLALVVVVVDNIIVKTFVKFLLKKLRPKQNKYVSIK